MPIAPAVTRPTAGAPPRTEASLETYFHSAVRKRLGGIPVKLAPTVKGLPDRLVLLPSGGLYLVELKVGGRGLEPAQRLWHERAARLGVHIDTLDGSEDVDRWIRSRADELASGSRRQSTASLNVRKIYGAYCPNGCGEVLMLSHRGRVRCGNDLCPDPTAAAQALS